MNDDVITSAAALKKFCADVLAKGGLSAEHADRVADVLVWADLRGIDSHGVSRIPSYVRHLETGDMNPRPDMKAITETSSTVLLDADQAAGPVAMTTAMDYAMRKAREAGVGTVFVRKMTHAATLGYYTLAPAQAGMAAIEFVASNPVMAYHGAAGAGVSTSPICMAVPCGAGNPIILDMGTGVISNGRLMQARRLGQRLQEGWAIDKAGKPTTDPATAHVPLPMAGPKGSGLALMIELIASLVTSTPILAEVLEGTAQGKRHRQNGVLIAIDIARFCDLATFHAQARRLIAAVKALPPTTATGVLMPGEREDRISAENLQQGIAIPAAVIAELEQVAGKLGVAMFAPLGR
jgi:LDH2 family malate/lactate/ureidoglycolate dehydrogenase